MIKITVLVLLASAAFAQTPVYTPITGEERVQWVLFTTFGPRSTLLASPAVAAITTGLNTPEEWHGTWEGFGKRYGTRLATVAMETTIEASLGSFLGEDPRYRPKGSGSFKSRLGYAVKSSFFVPYRDGNRGFAYSQMAGILGSQFAANIWLPDSVNTTGAALERSGFALGADVGFNVFTEFLPEIRRKVFRRKK